jgi:hypothetical protein
MDPRKVWLEAAELVKDRIVAPTLYRAVEVAVGVAIEEETFVVGLETSRFPMASHLRSSQWKPVIEQAVSELVGRKLRLITIEGTTPEDYKRYLEMQAANKAKQSVIDERREKQRSIEEDWDEVADRIVKVYAGSKYKMLPQSRAALIKEGFRIVAEAVRELGYSDDAGELERRSFAKMLDKFAGLVDMPAQWLAYEFFRLREEGKL